MQIDPFLTPYRKLKSKWIKGLHIKLDTVNLIEKKVAKILIQKGKQEKFLNITPMAYYVR